MVLNSNRPTEIRPIDLHLVQLGRHFIIKACSCISYRKALFGVQERAFTSALLRRGRYNQTWLDNSLMKRNVDILVMLEVVVVIWPLWLFCHRGHDGRCGDQCLHGKFHHFCCGIIKHGLSGPCSHCGFTAVILVILFIADNGVIIVMVILVIGSLPLSWLLETFRFADEDEK